MSKIVLYNCNGIEYFVSDDGNLYSKQMRVLSLLSDKDGDYEPQNCRWVNRIIQANNTSTNRYITLNGKRLTIAEFARVMNISKFKARYRIELFEKGENDGQFNLASGGD